MMDQERELGDSMMKVVTQQVAAVKAANSMPRII